MTHFCERGHEVLVFAPEGAVEEWAGARVVRVPGPAFPPYPGLRVCLSPRVGGIGPAVAIFSVTLLSVAALGLALLPETAGRELGDVSGEEDPPGATGDSGPIGRVVASRPGAATIGAAAPRFRRGGWG